MAFKVYTPERDNHRGDRVETAARESISNGHLTSAAPAAATTTEEANATLVQP